MIGGDELIQRFRLDRAELVQWIENRWVLPEHKNEQWVFQEVDVARIELILHFRQELAVGDDAMPIVLGLLDQVYSLRRQLRRLSDALECQPAEIRDAVRRALAAPPRNQTPPA